MRVRASLSSVQTDLGKADIRSPIDGVVPGDRPGRLIVAASLQAPVLFTLAEDLEDELHVMVDEADVGSVQVGQRRRSRSTHSDPDVLGAHHAGALASNNTQKSSSSSQSSQSATSTGVDV